MPVDRHFGGAVNEITQKVAHHEAVFVGVNEQVLNLPDQQALLRQIAPSLFDRHHYIGESANHIVQVTGVAYDSQTL